MKFIIYDLNNKKLNNDLKQYLENSNNHWNYFKDYNQRVRIVTIFDQFNIELFKNFVIEKRKKDAIQVLRGIKYA